jgi:NAD+ diphosphatase
MLQDLPFGRLENEYKPVPPRDTDAVLSFRDNTLLVQQLPNGALKFPTVSEIPGDKQYLFRLHGVNYYLSAGAQVAEFRYVPVRQLRESPSRSLTYAAMTGWHLHKWYESSHFCGRCGEITVHDEKERMMRCPNCGNMIFPRINPAIIVGVVSGDRILLTKYAGRGYTSYALIAGFTEIGETLEQTVQREVMEEVGLKVKNIRYYKSQPWGIDGNILMGFFCDLEGDDTVRLDEDELALAQWHERNALPVEDDGYSLTREMIRIIGEGRAPNYQEV